MTLEELKKRALISAEEDGNEQEYRKQIVEAVNKVQNKLIVFAKNKIKYATITSSNNIIALPADCYELAAVRDSDLLPVSYTKVNNSEIKVSKNGTYDLKYKAFLPNISESTADNFIIDIEPIAESCMVAGVASWITVDNPELYDVLSNEYNNLLANLSQMPEPVDEFSNGCVQRIEGWYY